MEMRQARFIGDLLAVRNDSIHVLPTKVSHSFFANRSWRIYIYTYRQSLLCAGALRSRDCGPAAHDFDQKVNSFSFRRQWSFALCKTESRGFVRDDGGRSICFRSQI